MARTNKEAAFIARLQAILTSTNPEQAALYEAMIAAVRTQADLDGESTGAQFFAAMQTVLDAHKRTMDEVVTQNRAEADAKSKELAATKPAANTTTSETHPIAGMDKLNALGTILAQAITEDKEKQLVAAVADAELENGADTLDLDSSYHAPQTLITAIQNDQSNVKITGSGNQKTERVTEKGKPDPHYSLKARHISAAGLPRFVVRGNQVETGITQYDAVSLIAEEWLRENNTKTGLTLPAIDGVADAVKLHGTGSHFMDNVDKVALWIQQKNKLKNGRGVACDNRHYDGPVIHPGEELALPGGKDDLSPKMVRFVCEACQVKVVPTEQGYDLQNTVVPLPPREEFVPHEFVRQATPSTDGEFYRVGTNDHALMLLARSGVDARFTKEYYSLKNIVAREPVVRNRDAGQIGQDDFASREGPNPGNNAQSRLDDGKHYSNHDIRKARREAEALEARITSGDVKDKDKAQAELAQLKTVAGLYTNRQIREARRALADVEVGIKEGTLDNTEEMSKKLDALSAIAYSSHTVGGYEQHNSGTGGKGISSFASGDRTRVYFPGEATTMLEGDEEGTFQRSGKPAWRVAHGGNYAFTLNGILVPLGPVQGAVGASLSRPSHQEKFNAVTQRYGITLDDTALATVNFGGYDNIFRDEQARLTSPQEAPDRIYAYMHGLNAEQTYKRALVTFRDAEKTEDKQQAAEQALWALRECRSNMLVVRVDSATLPLKKEEEALRTYLKDKVDLPQIDTNLAKLGKLPVKDMPQEQLEDQQDYRILKNRRYRDIKPGETNVAYTKSEPYAYRTMNYFEGEIAKGKAEELSEKPLLKEMRSTWVKILNKPAAMQQLVQFIGTDPNAQIEFTNLLSDIHRNPENYGFKNRNEAWEKLINPLIGTDKEVQKEVYKQGNTSMLPFTWDDRFHNQNPKILAKALVENIKADPSKMETLKLAFEVATVTDGKVTIDGTERTGVGIDKEGRTDGRRYGLSVLRSFGAELTAPKESAFGTQYEAFAKTLGDDEAEVRKAVLDITANAERGASGRSVNAVQQMDNTYAKQQRSIEKGIVLDDKTAYAELTTTGHTANLAVNGLQADDALKPLARDAIIGAILRNPGAFDALPGQLKDTKSSSDRNKFGALHRNLGDAIDDAKRFQTSGDVADRDAAIQKIGKFYTLMEAKNDNNRGALRHNALTVMLKYISQDDAMSKVMVETIGQDVAMRDAFNAGVPGMLMSTDGVRVTNHGVLGKGRQFANTSESAIYTARYFTLPMNKDGEVKVGGVFGIGRHKVKINDEALNGLLNAGVTMEGANGATNKTGMKNPLDGQNANGTQNQTGTENALDGQTNDGSATKNDQVNGEGQQLTHGKGKGKKGRHHHQTNGADTNGAVVNHNLNTGALDAVAQENFTNLQHLNQLNNHGIGPRIYTGMLKLDDSLSKADQQQQLRDESVKAVSDWLVQTGTNKNLRANLLAQQNLTEKDRAQINTLSEDQLLTLTSQTLLDHHLVNVRNNDNQITLFVSSDNQRDTLTQVSDIGVASGIAKWWLTLPFIRFPHTPPEVICPTCQVLDNGNYHVPGPGR